MRDTNDSFMTRQQYRRLKNQRHNSKYHSKDNQNREPVNHNGYQPRTSFQQTKTSSIKELKTKRLSRRLNKIIAVIILLIIIVYLILIFVNF